MKCASPDCSCAELTKTDPCVVCGLGVHHICSNDIYDSGSLLERFCSATCLYKWKTLTSSPSAWAESETNPQTSSSQATLLPDSQVSTLPFARSAECESLPPSQEVVVDLTIGSADTFGVDAFGIPLAIQHHRQRGGRHLVLDIMHRLDTEYESKDGRYATHICILCTRQQTSNPYAEPDAWESGLYRAGHTTNALDHMFAIHRDHPIGQAVAASKMKNASRQIDEAMAEARSRECKRSSPTVTNRPSKQRGTLQKLWAPTQKELGVFTAYWLINAGLPHYTIASEDFKLLIQRATGDSDATTISASTYRDLLRAVFCKFCKMTANLLLSEFDAALRTPFLNLHHDIWTTANGKKGMLGTSACWIDKSWTFREVALLLSVTNGSHASLDMKRMISFRMKELYSIDIDSMTQFAVSDTTASARKVSKLFEDALPTDCHMHILNLYLQYAIGIRENKETVSVYDPKTGTKTRNKRYCTVGGEFKKGRLLIKAVRDLNNHFSTDQRCKGLEDVQDFFSLPKLKTTVDCETRVAYTVKLFQHSIVNYSAFQGYFKKRGEEGDESVFNNLTHADWKLMAEMEAIVGSFADLARAEVQRNDLVASELVVLLKYTEERLYCNEFMIYDIDSPRFTTTTVASFPRFNVPVEHLSDLGQRCLARLKGQVEKRLAKATPETVMILLLDPRTKFSAKALIRPTKTHADARADEANDDADETKFIQDIIAAGIKLLTDAHREVFCAMNALSNDAVESAAPVSSANLDLVPTAEEGEAICGAPIKSTTPGTTPATLLEQADKKLEEWLTYSVDWVQVAQQQLAMQSSTAEDLTPLLLVRRDGVVFWRVEALCEYVNILHWFRDHGSKRFPSIAALARVWLGRSPSNAFQERVFSTGGLRDEQSANVH